jgi:hypothetical protein
VTIIEEIERLDRRQQASDTDPQSAWLITAGAIARCEITDPETVRQLLVQHGKTTDDLRRALDRHKQIADHLRVARTLPGLERHAEELSRRVSAKTAEAGEIPQTIAAKNAEAARLREEVRALERQAMQSLADQVESRSLHRRLSNDATTARAALGLLLEHDAIAQLPPDLREAAASVAHLEAEAMASQQSAKDLHAKLSRAIANSDEQADLQAEYAVSSAALSALGAALDTAREKLMQALET